ncbi:MAG TPA: thiolase family protein [Streptosporangiaceae bacterium]|nr:thiolase family protein [Streptosporangiaceae bacterium]
MLQPLRDNDAVIIEAVRTPVGKRNGALSGVHPADLAAPVLQAVLERPGVDSALVGDLILGCVLQVGEQALNIARSALLGAGWSQDVPGVTVDRQCGSGQQAVSFAAQGVMSGVHDILVAGGTESMSRVPMFSNVTSGPGRPYGELFRERYQVTSDLVHQGNSAEMVARKWGLSREQLDEFSLESHRRAARAQAEGRFGREIVPVVVTGDDGPRTVDRDEGVRPGTSLEALARLKPVFEAGGVITAGNSSQISDAAAALLITSYAAAKRLGLTPRARVAAMSVTATDPILMLTGPIPATGKVLARAGLSIDDIGVFEVNEAFAPVVAAWMVETGARHDRVNPNGGAIALGHPLGASGARLMVTLLHEMERSGSQFGLQTMCEGGGTSSATVLELIG